MKSFSVLLRCSLVLVSVFAFTSCKDYLSDNNDNANIGLPSGVNVMNTDLANAKSRTGNELTSPDIHTSKIVGTENPVYLRYTTAPGIQLGNTEHAKTRGTAITGNNFYNSYCLYTYNYTSYYTWNANASTITASYPDEEVYRARNWSTSEFWPGAGTKCAFFAYSPYHAQGLSAFTTTGWPTFHYTVPTSATDQSDLLVTKNVISAGIGSYGNIDVPGNFNMKDSITFDHACTAVRIAIGNKMAPCTIKKIEISNVYGEGDYQYQTESWTNLATPSTFSLVKDFEIKPGDSNYVLNNDDNVFMMLPQQLPMNSSINITLNDGVDHVLKASIDKDIWAKGYTVTYYLSTTEVDNTYVLAVSSSTTSVPISGGTNTMTINSYKQTYYGSQVAVPWTASYTYDEAGVTGTTVYNYTSPAVTAFTASSGGSISGQSVAFSVSGASVSNVVYRSTSQNSPHTKTLREAADGSCDLSAGKETANCYVVNAPGHYSFPLVYGNALNADKTINTNSYGTATFVDHQGIMIDNPYIYQTNGGANVPYDACIVWQDAPQLVTSSSVKLSSDMHSIEFDVDRNNICQGNCLIAVRDKNQNIMWSWHIWVTDHDIFHTHEVHNNPSSGGQLVSNFMEVPLGWCDPDVRVGDSYRNFHLTINQTEIGGQTAKVSISQLGGNYTYGINATYYQWGRKDPFLPGNGMGNTDKPYYNNQYPAFARQKGLVATNVTIANPNVFYFILDNSWSTNNSLEFWNKGNTSTVANNSNINKTIYDPSPSGFRLPQVAAYSGFPNNGSSGFNGGWNFFTYPNGTGPTIFFAALGSRDSYSGRVGDSNAGSVGLYGSEANYWSATPAPTSYQGYLLCSNVLFAFSRCDGLTVWPVTE